MSVTRARVVVAGLGDTGTLTAIHLARHADVVGISPTPGLISGQELGLRLARPAQWRDAYAIDYRRYRRLDDVAIVQARLTGADLDAGVVTIEYPDGRSGIERFDVLVIATGVANGFWRSAAVRDDEAIASEIQRDHDAIAAAATVLVIGGGPAAVSVAANVAITFPDKRIELCFPGERALPAHHRRTWDSVRTQLLAAGVRLRPGHRALVDGDVADVVSRGIAPGRVQWVTGQAPSTADAVIWAIGAVSPHTGWLPRDVLDSDGFVEVRPDLRTRRYDNVFAVGDVAATDPLRSSARNRADRLVARNVRAHLDGDAMREFRAPRHRWGSVVGPQADGLTIFTSHGRAVRIPDVVVRRVLWPVIVRRGIYGGVRDE